jgi:hypothetical protein
MNKTQKSIFLFMITVDTIIGLFPPWLTLERINPKVYKNVGYSFLLSPPSSRATINVTTLSVQFILVTMISLLLIYFFKSENDKTANLIPVPTSGHPPWDEFEDSEEMPEPRGPLARAAQAAQTPNPEGTP